MLVTGASGGIGRRLCLAFARDGFWVGVHYFSRRDAADDTLAELTAAGGQGALFQADIRSRDDVQAMVDDLQRRRGRLDVLVCNAGIAAGHLVVRCPEEAWQRIIDTNLSGTYRSMTAAAAVMTTGGGSILVIGSYAGLHGTSGQGAYAASRPDSSAWCRRRPANGGPITSGSISSVPVGNSLIWRANPIRLPMSCRIMCWGGYLT